MKFLSFFRTTCATVLCVALTACGGEKLPTSQIPSVSESTTTGSENTSSAIQQPAQNKYLTANTAVEGSLQLVESNLFSDYDYYGAFTNGWAFVVKGTEAGYLSEAGEYKPLYSIPAEKLTTIDVFYEMDWEQQSRRDLTYYLTTYYACNENGIVPYYKDGKWGYSDLDGNIIVEPIYTRLTPLGAIGMGCRKDSGSMSQREYDILDSNGNVIASGNCWADTDLGYYLIEKNQSEMCDLYNVDGSIIATDVWCAYGNYFRPAVEFETYPGGVKIEGVLYDRTGKKLEVDPAYNIIYINEDGILFYDGGDAGVGALDQNGNVVFEPSISAMSFKDSNGNYCITLKSGIIRKYDAQFNELPSQPVLDSRFTDSHFDENTGDTINVTTIFNQDGEAVMELEASYPSEFNGMYYNTMYAEEGDWMFWFPNEQTRIVYHVERAQ